MYLQIKIIWVEEGRTEYKNFNNNTQMASIHYQFYLLCIIIKMKGSQTKKPIFIQIGRNLATSKPYNKRPSISFASSHTSQNAIIPNPAFNNVNQTQPALPKRKYSQPTSSINKTYAVISNINDDFLFMRKENYLNSKFNLRKNKLKEISKENKQLHERINSQKSCYSSTDLNKSFQSNCQIKKRLSQSKLSQRLNSSRSSSRSKNGSSKGIRFQKKKQVKIAIKTKNIKDTQSIDLKGFMGLFHNDVKSTKNQPKLQKDKSSFKSYRVNEPYARNFKIPERKSIDEPREIVRNEGGLLHRIAEQMIGSEKLKGKQKNKQKFSRNKKLFNL